MARIKTDSATEAATQLWQRARQTAQDAKPIAAQAKPLANDAKAAASRGLYKARSWSAPRVDRTGQVLQDTVAPKVAAALHSSAQRLEPDKPRHIGWRIAAGIAALLAAAGAVVAAVRSRTSPSSTTSPGEDAPTPAAAEQEKADAAHTS